MHILLWHLDTILFSENSSNRRKSAQIFLLCKGPCRHVFLFRCFIKKWHAYTDTWHPEQLVPAWCLIQFVVSFNQTFIPDSHPHILSLCKIWSFSSFSAYFQFVNRFLCKSSSVVFLLVAKKTKNAWGPHTPSVCVCAIIAYSSHHVSQTLSCLKIAVREEVIRKKEMHGKTAFVCASAIICLIKK